tara:strand:+ start:141 stop:578 length:438 start_codon:yes stop_codon:yes gene_type:complete
MVVRFQRLTIILISLILLIFAAILILTNSKKNLIFFYTPTELLESEINLKTKIRIGGFVKEKTFKKNSKGTIFFVITDNLNNILVEYNGILPDLFREGQGTVVEGFLIKKNKMNASKVFAKHDENYMPASIKKQLMQKNYWRKNY